MGMAKKGSRKITVKGIDYRWRVSIPRRISDWRLERDLLDERYLKIAIQYGLGEVADVVFTIPIELYKSPRSRIVAKYFGLIVDGFLGMEQFAQVTPGLIAQLIVDCRHQGWDPKTPGNISVEIFENFENRGKKLRPAVIVIPGKNEAEMLEYSFAWRSSFGGASRSQPSGN